MKYSAEDLEKIAKYEEKRGIKYQKAGGGRYKAIFFLGIISWIYMLFTSFSYILGRTFLISANKEEIDNPFITILISASVALISILLYVFRFKVSYFITNIITGIITFISFAGISDVDDSVSSAGSAITVYDQGYFGLKKIFYWRHGIPIFLLIIFFSILIYIIIKERLIIKKELELIKTNDYKQQIVSDDE